MTTCCASTAIIRTSLRQPRRRHILPESYQIQHLHQSSFYVSSLDLNDDRPQRSSRRQRHRPPHPQPKPLHTRYGSTSSSHPVRYSTAAWTYYATTAISYIRHPIQQQHRCISSWLPDVFQNFSVWGGSGYLLKTLHGNNDTIPYWACFALISLSVRISLLPLVAYGAQTSSRFARVVPEVQFLLSLLTNDLKKLRQDNAPLVQRIALMRTNFQTLSGIYKLHNIHPFAIFLSPVLQLPIFWYISVDLRKIVNGLDPILAQQLVEGGISWIPDLTEPDPWFGLPVMAGMMMYWNVEVAIGKRSLSGVAASKSDTGILLKDIFQSVAVLMPCFTCQLPSGVQIYLVTSFTFTLLQSAALRTESIRQVIGLPSMLSPPPEPKYAKEFVQLKQLEQQARDVRGSGPVLGKGVLAANLEVSFPGEHRRSTIAGSNNKPDWEVVSPTPTTMSLQTTTHDLPPNQTGPFIHGISAPRWQLSEQQQQQTSDPSTSAESDTTTAFTSSSVAATEQHGRDYLPHYSDEIMDKANRGEMPRATQFVQGPTASSSAASDQSPTRLNLSKKGFTQAKGNKKRTTSSSNSKRKRGS